MPYDENRGITPKPPPECYGAGITLYTDERHTHGYKNHSLINYLFTLKKLDLSHASPRHLLFFSPYRVP